MGEKSLKIFVFSIVALLVLGVVMLLSTSVFIADRVDIYHDVQRQFIWLGLGIIVCAVTSSIDYHFWDRSRWVWFYVALFLLILCFIPPIAQPANGSSRWIGLSNFGFDFARLQPSELAKIAVVFVLAGWCSKYNGR